ncbi:hypothetical protein EXIGLDRAFT_730128 [Exidia glandulosa HHB12029]|uniref:Uncharacterized protein n=1 Tax=Exidia glandulosa HHB12029 TaxID=1314781 RepID=A0A165YYX9_EXIGL|nr:hypothetical protein EXIGLDRAFT_719261 [Exidia glandulosa HHB12029]KZV77947.1 hypothetical protein EXIGLDRAFT_719217 [Exidia glandulosa HHB12029]KZV82162.1 hypothetical protein EXIGLDRAFT_730128 [Exidia glandulosa HHB12029]
MHIRLFLPLALCIFLVAAAPVYDERALTVHGAPLEERVQQTCTNIEARVAFEGPNFQEDAGARDLPAF